MPRNRKGIETWCPEIHGTTSTTRLEFSPAIKKIHGTSSIKKVFTEYKKEFHEVLEYILCVSVAKRDDLETPTKSALFFFVRGEKRKTFFYFFLLGGKTVFTTPLTRNTLSTNIPLTSLTSNFR